MYRIKNAIVEKLKEQGINTADLLQTSANIRKHKIKKAKENILRITEDLNERIKILHDVGATNEEIIKLFEDAGMVVDRNKND